LLYIVASSPFIFTRTYMVFN